MKMILIYMPMHVSISSIVDQNVKKKNVMRVKNEDY